MLGPNILFDIAVYPSVLGRLISKCSSMIQVRYLYLEFNSNLFNLLYIAAFLTKLWVNNSLLHLKFTILRSTMDKARGGIDTCL